MPTSRARDYGAIRRYGLAHVLGAVIVVTAGVGFVTFEFVRDRNANMATAKAWDIQGPPCPQLTEAQWTAKHEKAPKTFDYDGVKLGRWSGDASCSDVHDKGGKGLGVDKVCQFTSPLTLTVVSPAGAFYFLPDMGKPATLIIHKDVPRCVMASKFTLQTE
jgi:hypothetical protein